MPGQWNIVLCDENGNQKGELDRSESVTFGYSLNRPAVHGQTFSQEHPMAQYVVEEKSRIRGYRDGDLQFYGNVGACSDAFGETDMKLTVTAASPLARLGRRTLQADLVQSGTNIALATEIVETQNARLHTGIRTTDTSLIGGGALSVQQARFLKHKNALEAIRDMANAYDGFDFDVLPAVDDADSDVMGDLAIWTERGTENLEVFYEYAEGQQNVLTAEITNETERITTNQWVLGRDGGDVDKAQWHDTAMETEYNAIFDSVDAYSDLADLTMLGTIAKQFQIWRSRPRQVVRFVPSPTAGYRPFDDFNLGDYVTFRLRQGRYASSPLDGAVRIYGFTIEIDSTGQERVTSIEIEPNDQGGG